MYREREMFQLFKIKHLLPSFPHVALSLEALHLGDRRPRDIPGPVDELPRPRRTVPGGIAMQSYFVMHSR